MIWKMLAAPIIGAIIGYCTNWLAVKMLFRPRTEKYIGKFKVPFTPGVIPKGKARLAKAMGDVVTNQLLTKEAVEERLLSDEMISSVKNAVNGGIEKLKADESCNVRKLIETAASVKSEKIPEIDAAAQTGEVPAIEGSIDAGTDAYAAEVTPESICEAEIDAAAVTAESADSVFVSEAEENTECVSQIDDAIANTIVTACDTDTARDTVTTCDTDIAAGIKNTPADMMIAKIQEYIISHVYEKLKAAELGKIAGVTASEKIRQAVSGSFFGAMMGDSIVQMAGPMIGSAVNEFIDNHAEGMIRTMICDETDNILQIKAGTIIEEIENNGVDIAEKAADLYVELVKSKSGQILEMLDIGSIARGAVEAMDNEQLENLVMTAMKTELKSVVNLGAVIGLILGLINMVIYTI